MASSPERAARRLALAVLALAVGARGETGRLSIGREAIVGGDVIRVRDVATLEGAAAEALGDVPLGPAPAAGDTRTLDGAVVLGVLRRNGLDPAALVYSIAPSVRVRRASQELAPDVVRQAVAAYVGEVLGDAAADATVREVDLSGPVRVPLGTVGVRVVAATPERLCGRVSVQLEVSVDGRQVKTVWAAADVERYATVVVLRRALARGEVVDAADVETARRDLSQVPRDALTLPADAVGQLARAAIPAYVPLRREHVAVAPVVRRGDVVLMIAERPGLRVTAAGEVRDDGPPGAQVRVVNRASRRELIGRVMDPSTVAVEF